MTTELATTPEPGRGQRALLVARFAQKYGIEPQRMLETLKQTCFRTERPITNEQMAALLLVCEANDLNPFVRMVHALLDKQGNVVPYIGFDGWISLVNRHPDFDGVELELSKDGTECTCTMYRRSMSHPFRITEYLVEVKRGSTPWTVSPRRMLRTRAYVQTARIAFGFPGLHDEAEARQIVYEAPAPTQQPPIRNALETASEAARAPIPVADVVDDDDDILAPKTLAAWMLEVVDAPDQESSALICDEAKSLLPPEQHAQLAAAYRNKWTPEENT